MATHAQWMRLDRGTSQPFYVLSSTRTPDGVECAVSGSTGTPYTCAVKTLGGITCTCPDMHNGARKQGCVCKHICFLVVKVGKLNPTQYLVDKKLSVCERGVLESRLLDPTQWCTPTTRQNDPRPRDPDADCPVCYNGLAGSSVVTCGTCRNGVHAGCWARWKAFRRTAGAATCVFCRTPMPM